MPETALNPELRRDALPMLDEAGRAMLFSAARTANVFASTPVSDDQLREIWDLAKWPPTSTNSQPLRVTYVRSSAEREALVGFMNEGNKHKTASAPAAAILAVDLDFHEYIPTVLPFRPEMRETLAEDVERRHTMAGANGMLQAAYFILAVRAVGLAAGPMGGFDREGVDAHFFPGDRYRSIMVVNIGHPGEHPWRDRLPRLDDEIALRWV
jgi:3-hydroxypropanoate dehydrogenase